MSDQEKKSTEKEQPKKTQSQADSERFALMVQDQFCAEIGDNLKFTDYEKTLAQHLYIKIDTTLKTYEAKREQQEQEGKAKKLPYTWANVNLVKLALDAVNRVGLGLDALLSNHVNPIVRWNSKLQKYDVLLQLGYMGEDYCRRELAIDKPIDIRYHLVHETDVFKPIMKDAKNEVENYEFEIKSPAERGSVSCGFGYIVYDDPKKNRLVIVDKRDFERSRKCAETDMIWKANDEEMMFKTVVLRTAGKIALDPKKVNSRSYALVTAQEAEERMMLEMDQKANSEAIDIQAHVHQDEPAPPPEKPADNQENKRGF